MAISHSRDKMSNLLSKYIQGAIIYRFVPKRTNDDVYRDRKGIAGKLTPCASNQLQHLQISSSGNRFISNMRKRSDI